MQSFSIAPLFVGLLAVAGTASATPEYNYEVSVSPKTGRAPLEVTISGYIDVSRPPVWQAVHIEVSDGAQFGAAQDPFDYYYFGISFKFTHVFTCPGVYTVSSDLGPDGMGGRILPREYTVTVEPSTPLSFVALYEPTEFDCRLYTPVFPEVELVEGMTLDWGDGTPVTEWTPLEDNGYLTTPIHSYAETGDYTVRLTRAYDNGYCRYLHTSSITVQIGEPPTPIQFTTWGKIKAMYHDQ